MKSELKSIIRNDFHSFARKAIVELSGTKIGDDRYLEYLGSQLMDFVEGKTRRLIVNLPPRHLKTSYFSVCLAAWHFAHNPSAKIMIVTYAEQLAKSIARDIRSILQSEWFKEVFPTRVAKDHAAVMDFGTTAGGALYASSFSGITGRGGDLIIIDDPHDIADAGNPQQLERTIDLFGSIVMSRFNNRRTGKVIVVAHRIHENDLSGHLLRQGTWRHVVLPMVAMSDVTYDTNYGSWQRRKGELLRPDAFEPEDVEDLKTSTHNPDFEMLYQQDADGRALPRITEDCFRSFAIPPSGEPCVMSVDAGMTSGLRNSFSVIQVWSPVGSDHYLVDQWREKCEFVELQQRFLHYFGRYRPSAILVERAANGYALISVTKRKNRKLLHEIIAEGSKTSRLRRHVDLILAHHLLLPKHAAWRNGFVAEYIEFPHGEFTDQVDATTQYLDWIAAHPRLQKPPPRLCVGINGRGQKLSGPLPFGRSTRIFMR